MHQLTMTASGQCTEMGLTWLCRLTLPASLVHASKKASVTLIS